MGAGGAERAGSPETDPAPRALSREEIPLLVEAWAQGARRAEEAGFDVLEIHGAHGYLVHEFLSPFSNRRNDEYGGSDLNRMRFCIEIVEAVRARWPREKPLFLRLSVGGQCRLGARAELGVGPHRQGQRRRRHRLQSGGMTGSPVINAGPVGYGYQVPYAAKIRAEAGLMTMAVGLIVHADQAETILQSGEADLIAIAREVLYNPNWPMDAAQKLGVDKQFASVPPPQAYWLSKRASSVKGVVPSTFQRGLGETR